MAALWPLLPAGARTDAAAAGAITEEEKRMDDSSLLDAGPPGGSDGVVRLPVPFVHVYEQHYDTAVRLAYVLVGDWQTAERVAQQAFLAVQAAWDQVGCEDEPGHALKRAVAERALTPRAGPGARLGRLAGLADGHRRATRAATAAVPVADSTGFWAALRRLPKRQAQVVALYYLEGRSITTVAAILGCGALVAQAHLDAGRAALAADLDIPLQEGP
jgi:DNA-directed RNA polymerase specialized sigma24 family protein